jgi:hypothetical protein
VPPCSGKWIFFTHIFSAGGGCGRAVQLLNTEITDIYINISPLALLLLQLWHKAIGVMATVAVNLQHDAKKPGEFGFGSSSPIEQGETP